MAMRPLNPENDDAMRDMFGPQQVDHTIRQAIAMCWMSLPNGRRTVQDVDIQIRRLVDRALRDLHEDSQQFGIG